MIDPPGRDGTSAPAWPSPQLPLGGQPPATGRRRGRPRTGAARQPGFLRGAASRASGGLHSLRRNLMREGPAARSAAVYVVGPESTLVSQNVVRASRRPGASNCGAWRHYIFPVGWPISSLPLKKFRCPASINRPNGSRRRPRSAGGAFAPSHGRAGLDNDRGEDDDKPPATPESQLTFQQEGLALWRPQRGKPESP